MPMMWTENFDIMLFVECRTLNRLGHMTGREFLEKVLEPIRPRVGAERFDPEYGKDILSAGTTDEEELMEDVIEELTRKASIGRVLILLDGLDEVHGVGTLAEIKPPAGMDTGNKFYTSELFHEMRSMKGWEILPFKARK